MIVYVLVCDRDEQTAVVGVYRRESAADAEAERQNNIHENILESGCSYYSSEFEVIG